MYLLFGVFSSKEQYISGIRLAFRKRQWLGDATVVGDLPHFLSSQVSDFIYEVFAFSSLNVVDHGIEVIIVRSLACLDFDLFVVHNGVFQADDLISFVYHPSNLKHEYISSFLDLHLT